MKYYGLATRESPGSSRRVGESGQRESAKEGSDGKTRQSRKVGGARRGFGLAGIVG